jgi:antitoxin component HigA of HigAB toxin-antitoxin module
LQELLKDRDMNASDLGRLLGNRQLGAAILWGERQLSKAHIRILSGHFELPSDVFLG